MKDRGVTLIELLVVITVIGILAVALAFSYVGWMGRFKVESEIKTLHAALLDARARAMYTGQAYFMDISSNGRFYRISQDDSNGTEKSVNGHGIFQQQELWTTIQATNSANWGAVAVTKDTTVTALSRKLELTNNPPTAPTAQNSTRHAGLLAGSFVMPGSSIWPFRLGFDKRGIIRIMILSGPPLTVPPSTNIGDAISFEN